MTAPIEATDNQPTEVQTDTAPYIGWSFLRSRRWFGYVTLLLLFAVACTWFGNWQFDRRAEARAEIARIDANYDAPALALTKALPSYDYFDENQLKWQTVEVYGSYVGEPYFARNRPGPGGVGSQLLQPLQLHDGSIFIVDRGWVPVRASEEIDPSVLPSPPVGEVTVQVRLRESEPPITGRTETDRTLPSVDLALLDTLIEAPLYTGAYGQLVSESPAAEHGSLPSKPERDEGPHLSYALQWYVFILIALLGVVYAARQEFRNLNPESEQVKRQDLKRAKLKSRRAPSDDEEEDAILDAV